MAYSDNLLTMSYIKSNGSYVDDGIRTIPDCLLHHAEVLRHKEAMIFADYEGGREVVTWKELYDKSVDTARSLKKIGIKEGEFVAINLRPCPEWLFLTFGTMMIGATPVCVSFTYKDGSDLVALMKKLERCSALVMDPGFHGDNWNVVKSLIDSFEPDGAVKSSEMPYLRYLISHRGCGLMNGAKQLTDLVKGTCIDIDLPNIKEENMAILLQTSGSTGVPKLVVHTHASILCIRKISSNRYLEDTTIQFNDRPFSWSGGFPFNLLVGQKRVTVSGFSSVPSDKVSAMIDIIQRERCTMVSALPPMLHALIQKMSKMPEKWPVEILLTSGQPLTKSLARAIGRVTPSLKLAYGGVENLFVCGGIVSKESLFQEFWCGKAFALAGLEVRVVDDEGRTVPVNTRGELYIKTPSMFKGYFNDQVKTSEVLTKEGWLKTDDIGMIKENGELYVFGRKSDMIISGGMNVAPEILEQVIARCPGIASVVVVPVTDDVMYQVVCACVTRHTGSDLTEEQLRIYCSDIHNDKPGLFTVLPKYYLFLDEFPETFTGKTDKSVLRKMATERFC